jgi:tRNA-Thr(GGU) m(6)t(6)A37 methyltransferase TsaA
MPPPPVGLTVIGYVRSAYSELAHTPVQSSLNRNEGATIEIDPALAAGLDGLEGFDYAWLLTWLHATDPANAGDLRQVPFLARGTGRAVGIFATRGPRRINPIGLSLIRVLGVSGAVVRFNGVDVVDGTPVVDLKPYVAAFDQPGGRPRCGWLDQVALPPGATPASLGGAPPVGD